MSFSNSRVSVLMAVFNTAEYLQKALESISNQSYTEFEFIALDDGSTDGSTEILMRFAEKEPRFKLITRENRGLIVTRNELLHAANSNFIAWMDSDDISLPNRLELQINRFDNDLDLVCLGGVAQCVDPDGYALNFENYPLAHEDILIAQKGGGAMRFPATMMRRDIAISVGGFREPFKIGEDLDLLIRMSEVGKMANLSDTIYVYRQHLKNVCATLGPQWSAYRDQILALANERQEMGSDKIQRGEIISIPTYEVTNQNRLEAHTYMRWSISAFTNENRRLALKYISLSIFSRTLNVQAWKHLFRVILNRRY